MLSLATSIKRQTARIASLCDRNRTSTVEIMMGGTRFMPMEILDQIVFYTALSDYDLQGLDGEEPVYSTATLKKLRLVNRQFYHSASRLFFGSIVLHLGCMKRSKFDAFAGFCQKENSRHIRDLKVFAKNSKMHRRLTEAHAARIAGYITRCIEQLQNVRYLSFFGADNCPVLPGKDALRHELRVANMIINALHRSVPLLTGLCLHNLDGTVIARFSGKDNPGMAAVISRLQSIELDVRDSGSSEAINLNEIFQHAKSLRWMCLVRVGTIRDMVIHPDAPLQTIRFSKLEISSTCFSNIIRRYEATYKEVALNEVNILRDNLWRWPTTLNTSKLDIDDSSPHVSMTEFIACLNIIGEARASGDKAILSPQPYNQPGILRQLPYTLKLRLDTPIFRLDAATPIPQAERRSVLCRRGDDSIRWLPSAYETYTEPQDKEDDRPERNPNYHSQFRRLAESGTAALRLLRGV
ncbi:hypothetical protein BDV25DRAFT_136111 [Aspergillus avenaceus]|uniref:Uncharacterized protein n=1 Tax=Aspergillus avenaceus TaxID=36643 RepID=A0A5N6U6B6_ASPAV|nr:hypothetical protein BDV25DRAFT_136111 [Aspergillus avenaceus]